MGNGTEDSETAGPEVSPKDVPDDDWVVECSDDETYNPAGLPGAVWEPRPEDAKLLYERLSRGETLSLQWTCPGRRSPSPEKHDDEDEVKEEPEEEKQGERALPSGFDFDEDMDAPAMKPGFTPRRTPGSGQTPRSQKKRVACMDKIMNDIRRHKKIEAAELKATPGRRLTATPGTGQRKLTALGRQRRLMTPGGDRRPGVMPAPEPTGADRSFNFGDDEDAGFEAPLERRPQDGQQVGQVQMGQVPAPALPRPGMMGHKETSPLITAKMEFPETPVSCGESGSKLNESLSSQMGSLTCKTVDEIKKEPLPSFGEPTPQTPGDGTQTPCSTGPLAEVKQELAPLAEPTVPAPPQPPPPPPASTPPQTGPTSVTTSLNIPAPVPAPIATSASVHIPSSVPTPITAPASAPAPAAACNTSPNISQTPGPPPAAPSTEQVPVSAPPPPPPPPPAQPPAPISSSGSVAGLNTGPVTSTGPQSDTTSAGPMLGEGSVVTSQPEKMEVDESHAATGDQTQETSAIKTET